jgi:hypothetical protein
MSSKLTANLASFHFPISNPNEKDPPNRYRCAAPGDFSSARRHVAKGNAGQPVYDAVFGERRWRA